MSVKSKTLLLAAFALLFGVGVLSYIHQNKHHKVSVDRKVTVDIGAYPNIETEQRASVQKLSAEMYQHPEANSVTIKAGKSAWRQGVMGFVKNSSPGNTNLFWYDDRFSSPAFGYSNGRVRGISVTHLVNEQPIHDAARKHGSPGDVTFYDDKLRVKLGLDLPHSVPAQRP